MDDARRRTHLGQSASAALPVFWAEIRARGLLHAQVAAALGEDPGKVAKILYGDRKPGRSMALKLRDAFGVAIELWDEPAPKTWRPRHGSSPSAPPPSKRCA